MVQRATQIARRAAGVAGVKLVAYAVMLVFALAAYGVIVDAIPSQFGFFVQWPIMMAIGFVSVFLHEMGHAVVAHRLGARIERIVVMPFQWDQKTRRIRLASARLAREVGGYVSYRLDTIDARRKRIWIALAGPCTDLIVFMLVLTILNAVGATNADEPLKAAGVSARWLLWLEACVQSLALTSLGAGIANLIPFDGSDGAQILKGRRRRPDGQ